MPYVDDTDERIIPEKEIGGVVYARVCRSDDVVERRGRKISFPEDIDMQIAIFRLGGKLYCLHNICPHRHADRIHEGIIKNSEVTCPLHGWTYSIESGENVNQNQGKKNLAKYRVFEEDGYVWAEKPDVEAIPKWRR